MKKLFSFFVLLFLIFGIISCSGGGTTIQSSITAEVVNLPVFLNVRDKVIVLGDEPNFLEGIEATDEEDGDLTDLIEVDSSEFNNSTLGSYTILITVTDSDANVVSTSYNYKVVNENEYQTEFDLALWKKEKFLKRIHQTLKQDLFGQVLM
jgi:hypothetical protein